MGNRKYPKTTGHYVYAHILPDKRVYFGCTGQKPCQRWKPKLYIKTELEPYIEEYGWDHIEHLIIQDGLTKDEASQIEHALIICGIKDDLCINKKRKWKNQNEYQREYQREYSQRPEVKEHYREYRQRTEVKQRNHENYINYKLKNCEMKKTLNFDTKKCDECPKKGTCSRYAKVKSEKFSKRKKNVIY